MRIAKSVVRLQSQRKYAFPAGEQPISRGEPKINKPYDKRKLCKTSIIFLISTIIRRGSLKMFLSAADVLFAQQLYQLN